MNIDNIFYSNKSDLVDINKYLVLNSDYYSPRTMTQSYNLGVRTVFSSRLVSTVSLGFSYYDYGLATPSHPEYFQQQGIFSSNINLLYETSRKLTGKIDPGINSILIHDRTMCKYHLILPSNYHQRTQDMPYLIFAVDNQIEEDHYIPIVHIN